MNKAEFLNELSIRTQLSKNQLEVILDTSLSIIKENVQNGEDVKFVGFGTFSHLLRKPRKGRNPTTGESIQIPEVRVPKFKAGKDFKDLLEKERTNSLLEDSRGH